MIHHPTLLTALKFFAMAVVFRSFLQTFQSRYQAAIFLIVALIVECNARTLFHRSPSSAAVLLYAGSAFFAIIMTKWAIEGLPWWLGR